MNGRIAKKLRKEAGKNSDGQLNKVEYKKLKENYHGK